MWDQVDVRLETIERYWSALAAGIKLSATDHAFGMVNELAAQAYAECTQIIPALWDESIQPSMSRTGGSNGSLSGLPTEMLTQFWRCAWFLIQLGELGGLQRSLEDIFLPIPGPAFTDPSLFGLDDSDLFEDPSASQQRYYLPRYRIAGTRSLGIAKYSIHLQTASEVNGLTVYLEPMRPTMPSFDLHVGDSDDIDPIPHNQLLFIAADDNVWQFDRITSENGLLRAFLPTNNLLDTHSLQQIISDPGRRARLIMRRVVEVEIPANTMRLSLLPANPEERTALRVQLEQEIAQLGQQVVTIRAAENAGTQTTPYEVPTLIAKNTEFDRACRLLRSKQRDLADLDAQLMFVKWPFVFDNVLEPTPFAFPPKHFPYIYETAR